MEKAAPTRPRSHDTPPPSPLRRRHSRRGRDRAVRRGGASGGDNLSTAAQFLLVHALALLALSLLAQSRALRLAAYGLLLGLLLFCGDLLARHFLGARLFAYAAPAGGLLMITGWLGVAVAAAIGSRR